MSAAGCTAPAGQTTSPATAGTENRQTAPSHAQVQATAAATETAQTDGSKVSFQYAQATPDWKPVEGFNAQYDYALVEDGQGALHLIYNDYELHVYHRLLKTDGSWSEPQQIVATSMNRQGYWAGTAPDGNLCFVWIEEEDFKNELIQGHTDVLHSMFYKDGKWQETPQTYDFKISSGKYELNISWFDVQFDPHGDPHFFYLAGESYGQPGTAGLYLDGQQITLQKSAGLHSISAAQGVGALSEAVYFVIDSKNVYHLLGCDDSSLIPDSYPDSYTRYLHSYSLDGGKTWKGPFTLFDGSTAINRVAFEQASDGSLHLMAYYSPSKGPRLLTTVLKPDGYEAANPEEYFSDEQIAEDLGSLSWEERSKYQSMSFRSVLFDGKGKLHYIAEGSGPDHPALDLTQIKGNAWAIRGIEKPQATAELTTILLRRDDSFLLLAKETGKENPALYYAEIPAGQ
jgi:hypothetical protein